MKKTLRILIFFLVVAGTNVSIVFSQKSPTEKTSDEQRIRKISTSFMKRFYQTYDVKKIPRSFFVEDFWSHFENDIAVKLLDMQSPILSEIGEAERTKYSRSIIDCWVLFDFYAGTAKDENLSFAEILPKPAIEMLKSSIFLNGLLIDQNDAEIESPFKALTVAEFRLYLEEFNRLTVILRKSIKDRTKSQKRRFAEYSQRMKERFHGYRRVFCTGKECYGFAENTEIFYLTDFPLTFCFMKQNGRFRIFGLFPTFD
jgi:hypothetical protein